MKKILVINFFPAFFPPQSGGELRYYNMYHELSKYYDVTLLSPTYREHKQEVITYSETFREYRIPKEYRHDEIHMAVAADNICTEISALVCYLSAGECNSYHETYCRLYSEVDIIIHESPYMFFYDIYFGLDNKPRIYNSYNFEYHLVSQMWHGPNAEKYLKMIHDAERRLVRESDAVFAISEDERVAFIKAYGVSGENIHLAPNGIDVDLYEKLRKNYHTQNRKKAFFIGSAHPPNMEAVEFLCHDVAPQCPEIDFYIAGKCTLTTTCSLPNVHLLGLIDDEQKDELFATSDVAVNPMFSGAGTNLKTLEFLSAGIPMISTSVGVRGLELTENEQYVHAEREDFVAKLKEMLRSEEKIKQLAENGKKYINDIYSWESICRGAKDVIESIQIKDYQLKEKKTLLVLNDFEVAEPTAGGEVRIFYLLKGLANEFRVLFVCLNGENRVDIRRIESDFYHISLPKTIAHLREEDRVNQKCWISANDIVAGYMIEKNLMYMSVVKELSNYADAIVLEHPYLSLAVKDIEEIPIVYESLNFEYKLKRELLKPHPMHQELTDWTEKFEKMALEKAGLVVACASEELSELEDFSPRKNQRIELIRNGVSIPTPQHDYSVLRQFMGGKPIITFVGSGHTPNVEAASFIINHLAPQVPEAVFAIIGTVCGAFDPNSVPENVLLFGRLADHYKSFLLFGSDIALNPVEEGAGSNLKLAEYFAYGVPVVTTVFGARGYDIENGVHAIISERSEFVNHVRGLLCGGYNQPEMISRALEYAKKELSWEVLGERYCKIMHQYLEPRKRALVITYRWNVPARGGAEVFMTNVLKHMAERGNYYIDVVTTDMGDPQNKYHFSCNYTKDSCTDTMNPSITCLKFPIDTLEDQVCLEKCRELFCESTNESVKIARKFLNVYRMPLLMGGWHYPEQHDTGVSRWSSGEADIFIKDVTELIIQGTVSKRVKAEILLDGQLIKKKTLLGGFSLHLNNLSGKVLTIKVQSPMQVGVDPRPLGLYVHRINGIWRGKEQQIPIGLDYTETLRQEVLDDYINALIEIAKQREAKYNEMFLECRGPLSSQLQRWLHKNIENYDVVLGHSTPFNTLVYATQIARNHKVPVVLLPHFHMEDPFYHWQPYYDAFREADRVIAAPDLSKALFFDKIGARAVALPGGGVNTKEFEVIDDTAFEKAYNSDRPYILVLGRKAGAKNYQWVMEAVELLNSQGKEISMVMIGRNDDGLPVDSPNVYYMGEQSRQVVLGALKNCRFVVNMSESESFGIVILEAWLAGKTVVVNENCAAFTELVDAGVNGVLAGRENLSDKIWELWCNGGQMMALAERGKQKAHSGYSWQDLSTNVENLLTEVCSKIEERNLHS